MPDTNEQRDPVKEARELLQRITQGVRVASGNGVHIGTHCVAIAHAPNTFGVTDEVKANAELYARAPELIKTLCDELERRRKLHDYTSHADDCEWWGSIPRTTCSCGLARIEQIQRWRMLHVRANSDPYADRSRAFGEIDFLLSLLQSSEVAPNLTDGDKTRYLERGFCVVENAGHSLRLIKRDDPRQAISIKWVDLPALRELITLALDDGPMIIGLDISGQSAKNARSTLAQKVLETVEAMRKDQQIEADARRDPDAPYDYKGSYGLASGAVDACNDIDTALRELFQREGIEVK